MKTISSDPRIQKPVDMTDTRSTSARDSASSKGSNSQRGSPATSPSLVQSNRPGITRSPASNPNLSSLPPLVTSNVGRRTSANRIPSYANKRMSTLSNTSIPASRSRPGSTVFPVFHSSLPYTLVRDFAYDSNHILHYGPPPEPSSAASTNASDFPRRLSDPLVIPHQGSRTPWSGHPGNVDASLFGGPQLPSTSFADGPPWREDEDLLSPIVSTRHRKVKSDIDYFTSRDRAMGLDSRHSSYAGNNQGSGHNFYIADIEEDTADSQEGDTATLSKQNPYYQSRDRPAVRASVNRPHPNGTYLEPESLYDDDENRYSRDYSFSIASPDEEMHGKAIALFDFESENDNELPLKEGQVLWVSYRHGQGWLVAKDPLTGEDGLVPEAYVRLEREIQGGFGGLNGQAPTDPTSPVGPETPTVSTGNLDRSANADSPSAIASSQYPVVSHFTTSSKDLLPHDKHTNTPISTQFPSKQHDAQFDSVSQDKEKLKVPTSEENAEDPETDEDDTQPIRKPNMSAV